MRTIFISYRRDDAEGEAGRLSEDLIKEFGEASVFIDVAGIEIGRDFRKAIDESVGACGVLLAVIGRGWLDAKNAAGTRRLEEASDFVRLETATALKRGIPVIPVLVHGATMPSAEQLPADLKDLSYRNGCELTHARWSTDLQLLVKALRRYVDPAPVPPPPLPPPPPPKKKSFAGLWIAAVCVLAAIAAFWGYQSKRSPVTVAVPVLVGLSLEEAKGRLSENGLSLGSVTMETRKRGRSNTILSAFPDAGRKVDSGTSVDIVVSTLEATPPPPAHQTPNFAGSWQLIENTTDGKSVPVSSEKPILIEQSGDGVTIGGHSMKITPTGSVSYQTFSAHDDKYGHAVNTMQEADLIDTLTWTVRGDILTFETTFYYRNAYYNHPAGTELRVMKYRRVGQ